MSSPQDWPDAACVRQAEEVLVHMQFVLLGLTLGGGGTPIEGGDGAADS